MVQMTVFISDVRYGDHLTQIRRETFGDNFPGSAFIRPRILTQKLRFMVMP
jgi:2-iminobutanoate/2-iminopropanoate deaminase